LHVAAKLIAAAALRNNHRRPLMLRIVTSFLTILVISATAENVAASDCGQVADVAADRHRAPFKRQNSLVPRQGEEHCGEYSNRFFEAVKARQTVSTCNDGIDHRRDLGILDTEINELNNLIAAQCRGS
jgi:hypothetical protein